jgi:hypothetical protein
MTSFGAESVQLSCPDWLSTLSDEPDEEALALLEHTVAGWSHVLAQVLDQATSEDGTSQSEHPPPLSSPPPQHIQ